MNERSLNASAMATSSATSADHAPHGHARAAQNRGEHVTLPGLFCDELAQ